MLSYTYTRIVCFFVYRRHSRDRFRMFYYKPLVSTCFLSIDIFNCINFYNMYSNTKKRISDCIKSTNNIIQPAPMCAVVKQYSCKMSLHQLFKIIVALDSFRCIFIPDFNWWSNSFCHHCFISIFLVLKGFFEKEKNHDSFIKRLVKLMFIKYCQNKKRK